MNTTAIGPDDIHPDACALDGDGEPTPAQIEALERIERAVAETRENAARGALIDAARAFLTEYDGEPHAIRAVRFEANMRERDDDERGVRTSVDFRVALMFVDGADLAGDECITLGEGAEALEDVARDYGWAIPMDGTVVVTRDGVEVVS